MKKHLLIPFLLFSSVVLAQSKKERYAQLLAEMNTAQHKYDSTKQSYRIQHSVLETTFRAAEKKVRELENSENKIKDLSGSILEKTSILDDLGVDYTAILDKKIIQVSGNSGVLKKRLRAINLYEKNLPHLDTVHLKDLKTREKNERITKQLVVLKDETQKCTNQIQINRSGIDSVQKINQEAEDNLNRNKGLVEQFSLADLKLDKKLMELETAYLKEPKKFNKNYEKYFPLTKGDYEIAPVQAEPMIEPVQEPEIFEVVEEPATFPGGTEALNKYLSGNLVYPQTAKEAGISGKVYLKFVVSDKGYISNVKIMKGVRNCPECDKEALRVVKNMPNWIPAKNNGKKVNSFFILPVAFKL